MHVSRLRTSALVAGVLAIAVAASSASAFNANSTGVDAAIANPVTPRAPKRHVVKMITENGKQLFDPVKLTIQVGDTVSWLAVSGSHNVGFWVDSVPTGAEGLLRKAMPDTIAPLLGKRIPKKGDEYVVVFTGMPKGNYKYYCKPHLNKQMVGELTLK